MPILRLNAGPRGLGLFGSPASAMNAIKSAALGPGPVIIMIHGFKYEPDRGAHCPHTTIFAGTAQPFAQDDVQWMRHMGFGTGDPNEGLAIAFAWPARGNLWDAKRAAQSAGQLLERVIATVRSRAPHRPIHLVSHSMGSEVVFEALHKLPSRSVDRIVTLTGASYKGRAIAAMQTEAGCSAELINVTSRENDLFDFMYERLITPDLPRDCAMGRGIDLPNAVTLQLDCTRTLDLLARFGGHISKPKRRICRWSGYTRPGALRFYARAIRQSEAVPLAALRQALPPDRDPRWLRMFSPPRINLPLLTNQKTAS